MQRDAAAKKEKHLKKLECKQIVHICEIKGRLFGRNLAKMLKIMFANNKDAKFVIKRE